MFPRKCCVADCDCKNITCKSFYFPLNQDLRKVWENLVKPYSPKLTPGSNIVICIHHFEDKYLIGRKRKALAWPTLFTKDEINQKTPNVPLNFSAEGHVDHNYCLPLPFNYGRPLNKRTITATESQHIASLVHVNVDHNYYKKMKSEYPSTSGNSENLHQPLSEAGVCVSGEAPQIKARYAENNDQKTQIEKTQVVRPNDRMTEFITDKVKPNSQEDVPRSYIGSTNSGTVNFIRRRHRIVPSVEKLSPRCKKIYDTCTKIIRKKRKLIDTHKKKIEKVREMCQKKSLDTLLDSMTPAAKTFLYMQIRECNKHKKRRRFNDKEKIFALSLAKQSPKGYRFLKKIFVLPSSTTLNKFSKNISITSGLNPQLLVAIKKLSQDWDSKKKLCSIVFDEVALAPHLTYVETQDQIEGFVNFGNEKQLKLCDHALVIMIRGLCTSWTQPIAYYLCEGSTPATTLKNILREIVQAVVQIGLSPKALICDQGSTFRSCIRSFENDTRRDYLINNIELDNKIDVGGQKLHVIYDPPHLLKGIRNNLLDKNMIFQGKIVKWSDIVEVYKDDCELGEIRMLHKLTDEHVIPTKIKKMKVKHCTQVLSERTSAMLRFGAIYGIRRDGTPVSPTLKNTAEAVLFFDRLFDSVNGSRKGSAPGKMRGPVKEVNGVSDHVEFWRTAINKLQNIAFIDNRGRRVQVPSVKNWITTLKSFMEIWCDLRDAGVKYFYTRNLNQDPLENFFGRIRAMNYRNVHPDCYTFKTAYKSLLVCKMLGSHSNNFNCEEDMTETLFAPINEDPVSQCVSDLHLPRYLRPSDESSELVETASPLFQQARQEKIRVQAAAFTAGYVSRKLNKKFKCRNCKAIFLTTDLTNIHAWITFRERTQLRGRNLCYPSSRFIMLFRELIFEINTYLNVSPHNTPVAGNIKSNFLNNADVDWFGCRQHHTESLDFFIKLVCRLQIHNWCSSINKILKGTDIERLSPSSMTVLQRLALKKFKSLRGKK